MKSHERSRDRYLDAGVRGDRGSRRHRCLCWPSANACLSMWNTCACPTLLDISNDQQKARDYLALPSTQLISQMNSTTAPAPLYIFYITIVHYAKRKHRISCCFIRISFVAIFDRTRRTNSRFPATLVKDKAKIDDALCIVKVLRCRSSKEECTFVQSDATSRA